MRTSSVRWILVAACFLLFPLGASAGVPDSDKYWTTVGSAGTLDEESAGNVTFERAIVEKGQTLVIGPAMHQPDALRRLRAEGGSDGSGGNDETDSAVIRYNVTAVDGLFGVSSARMAVRFRAEGKSARVFAQLIEVDVLTGAEVTLLTFDSDDPNVPVSSGYHMWDNVCDAFKAPFNFVEKAYYVEATLTTSTFAEGSIAGIEAIQINATPCP